MIKKFFHYVCVIIASGLWIALLAGLASSAVMLIYHTTPLIFYQKLALFWNQGNVIHGRDLIFIMTIILLIPLCFYGLYRLYHFKYLKLLTVPLNKLLNGKFDGYVAPDVNIKNLKIEEKKTLDQFIKERLDLEKKKTQTGSSTDFRQEIIRKIQESEK